MDFSTAIKTCFSKFIDFTGRAPRSEFWYFFLFSFLLQLVVEIVAGEGVSGLIALGLLIPSFSVGARRLHDTNRTGWWQLLWFVPILGWIILIIFMAKRGDEGENLHGYDPLDRTADPHQSSRHDMNAEPAPHRSHRDDEQDMEQDDASNEDNPWVKIRREKAEAAEAEEAAAQKQADAAQKKITEEKKRRIEPPKFGRDAAKKGKKD